MSSNYILCGQDTYNLFDAIMRGDKEKEKIYRAKFQKEESERIEYETQWMKENLSPETIMAFVDVDKLYERLHYSTNRIRYHGSGYSYRWIAHKIEIPYEDYGKFPLKIGFRAGEFSLSLDWDTDHDSGTHTIMYGISPSDIINEIEVLRKRYVSGECK